MCTPTLAAAAAALLGRSVVQRGKGEYKHDVLGLFFLALEIVDVYRTRTCIFCIDFHAVFCIPTGDLVVFCCGRSVVHTSIHTEVCKTFTWLTRPTSAGVVYSLLQ